MKLVTISPYAITRNKYKESNSFNDQTSNFRKQIFTCSDSTKQTLERIFDLFKLIKRYYINAIDVILVLLLSAFGIAFRCIYYLFHMLIGVTYIEAEIQSTPLHLIELFRSQFLGNSPKITNQLFFKSFCGWLLSPNK